MPSETERDTGTGVLRNRGEAAHSRPIHELFEDWAVATPDAIAILGPVETLTYARLNERANRLANRLRALGVAPGALVGLCMVRSPEAVVALLGILKAGAAYVPLDPVYPQERLAFMLGDTAAPLVLAHRGTADRLAPFLPRTRVLCLDADADRIAGESAANPDGPTRAGDRLAYVMYTSGSTGRPKGVLVGHRAVVRLVRDTDYCRFSPGEVFLLHSPLSFDASTFEVWGALLNGARLAVLPPGPTTADALDAAIRRHGVTTLWLTAGLFHLLVDQRLEALAPLRQLLAGGDVLSPPHIRRALEAMRDGVLINGYGPTECTTFACCFRMSKGYQPGVSIPIGRPIPGTTAHVLDDQLRPVPAGSPGELYLGGDRLAEGYLNQPELTRDRFLPDSFRAEPGARLYRTGDRVRWGPGGDLEFLGRVDHQVKICGHRIEPGEIEAMLRQHPEVADVVVVAHPTARGEKQLAAYVLPAPTAGELSEQGLRQYLAGRLPAYMLPAHIVLVESMPLTANGKVDRAALPPPGPPRAAPAGGAAPATEWEKKIAEVCAGVFACPVGIEDNFFDLGANSLQVLEVHAALTRSFRQELSITELFEHATVRSLARRLAGTANRDTAVNEVQARARRQKEALARHLRLGRSGE